jgi:hypothetical protein
MARSRRVRQMSTDALIAEVSASLLDAGLGGVLDEGAVHRFDRVCRELARRDYRFRAHGKECACADCWFLWDTWTGWYRRAIEGDHPDGQ